MVTCKCEHCHNPNCTCKCEDALSCDCKGCGSKVEIKVKTVNPSDKFHCEGCSG
jgi:hypothetical protein